VVEDDSVLGMHWHRRSYHGSDEQRTTNRGSSPAASAAHRQNFCEFANASDHARTLDHV